MTRSLIVPLILKDWYLQRRMVVMALVGGLPALPSPSAGGLVGVFGVTVTFAWTVILAIGLAQSTVMNEKNKQNEPFVMSLPVTPLEYAAAKILANVSMFLVVWLVLMAGLFLMFTVQGHPGLLPPATVLAFAIVVGFCIMLSTSIVIRSERVFALTMTATNFAFGLTWLVLSQLPGLMYQAFGPVAVWSPQILWFLAVEVLVLVVALALGAFGQSRRTSFL
jgi:ABC-2 type transport system permease protein